MKPDLRHLPLLATRADALEKCVYCPKLCRAACPVSNAEPSESLIPWGKMSAAYFMARGDVPVTPENASVAWACTGCLACAERCDHKNPVAATLTDARAELYERGAAPAAAKGLVERWPKLAERRRAAVAELGAEAGHPVAHLLLGCSYATREPRTARLAVRVAESLLGGRVALAKGCCGYPLAAAGDRAGAEREREALAREVSSTETLVVLDAGCFRALSPALPNATLLLDRAARMLERFKPRPGLAAPRYHDPCQLGRGLGRYDQPRAILERVVGAPPLEFERARERADCAGAGGLLPLTRPAGAEAIAAERLAQHASAGGGPVATACGSSLHRLRKSGADVRDVVEYMAIGLGLDAD